MSLATLPALIARPVERQDLQSILELLRACEAVDQLDAHISLAELQRGFDRLPPNTVRCRYLWETEGGQTVGYGRYAIRDQAGARKAYPLVQVHPDYRVHGLESEILSWCEQDIQRVRPDAELWVGVRAEHPHYTTFYEQQGYTPMRWFHRMERSLLDPIESPQLPAGFRLRSCQGEEDVEAWVEMYNQTFIDHWEFQPFPVENRRYQIQYPTYRADLDWVALSPDGTFAAFCTCQINNDRNALTGKSEGWVAILGTRRGFRRQGLGRAMLLWGLQLLQAENIETALLGVDSENPNHAQSLYESVGFKRVRTQVSYKKRL